MINVEEKNSTYDAIISRRSIRRFQQKPISLDMLKKLVNAGRLAPSGANLQPLEFVVVTDEELCSKVFDTLGWAGYIKPSWSPASSETPVAYIVVLVRDGVSRWFERDVGFASENIVIAAESMDIGSCVLCKIDKDRIQEVLQVPSGLKVDSVIALGYKAEKSVAEDMDDSVKYWRDEDGVLHVPKRKLEDVLHVNGF